MALRQGGHLIPTFSSDHKHMIRRNIYILVFHQEHTNADHMKLNEDRDLCARVRKAYRPETFVGTILFSSLKYRSTPGMLRSLVGHSCDFQRAP